MNRCGFCVLSAYFETERRSRCGGWMFWRCMLQIVTRQRIGFYPTVFSLIFSPKANWSWLAVYHKDYLRLSMPNSWKAVRARTEMVRWITVDQLSKWRMRKESRDGRRPVHPQRPPRTSLCPITVRSLRMICKQGSEPESTSLLGLTSPVTISSRPSVWRVGWSVFTSLWL